MTSTVYETDSSIAHKTRQKKTYMLPAVPNHNGIGMSLMKNDTVPFFKTKFVAVVFRKKIMPFC